MFEQLFSCCEFDLTSLRIWRRYGLVVALQAVVCAWGVPEGLYNFVPEAIGQSTYYVRLRVSCCALSYLMSNMGVTL